MSLSENIGTFIATYEDLYPVKERFDKEWKSLAENNIIYKELTHLVRLICDPSSSNPGNIPILALRKFSQVMYERHAKENNPCHRCDWSVSVNQAESDSFKKLLRRSSSSGSMDVDSANANRDAHNREQEELLAKCADMFQKQRRALEIAEVYLSKAVFIASILGNELL